MGLQDEVTKLLAPGETIVISLSGSFGEALVVTDRRAMVAREQASGLDLTSNVYAHSLSHVGGAAVVPLGNGGYIELKLKPPVANIETARVYFPSSEDDRFNAAANYLSNLPTPREIAVAKSTAAAGGEPGICPGCKAKVDDSAAFCPGCGAALKTICLSCGHASPVGSIHCPGCGREMVEFSPDCAKCGARTMRWMSYCPGCGSMLRPICVGCGIQVQPDWTYCVSCGRQLGVDRLDVRACGSARKRMEQLKDSETQPVPVTPSEPRQPVSTDPAEEHNKRGTALFESEDYDGAIVEFAAAVAIDPNRSAYHCNLGMAYDECDRDDEALAEYQKALGIDPNDLGALMSIGYMYSEKEEFDKSKEAWDRILQIAPDSAEAQEVQQNLRHQGEL